MPLHKANILHEIYKLLFYDCHWFDASLSSKFTRAIIKRIPAWLLQKMESQQLCHHPQVAFLPLVEDMGTFRPGPQPSLAVKSAPEKTANCYVKETNLSTVAV
ncbi:hypothetical protein BGZ89_007436 [Linnemannia elongata]|nr:hypothetical protein BGZ89_007436 [Linnemannia elongata]